MPTSVSNIPPADSVTAAEHFQRKLAFETDCWDVHDALSKGADFVLLDVRGPEAYARGHVPGAVSLPHGKIVESKLAGYPPGTLFVVYCAGPHCNGAGVIVKPSARSSTVGVPDFTVRMILPSAGGGGATVGSGFCLSRRIQSSSQCGASAKGTSSGEIRQRYCFPLWCADGGTMT